jgi:hypothetical protein
MASVKNILRRHNPFWTTHTALPPLVLLTAKLVVAYLFHYSLDGPGREPFLPLWTWLDAPLFHGAFLTALDATYYLAVVLLLFNIGVRPAAFWIGLATLWMVLSNRNLFSNSTTFAAFLLILIGLYTAPWGLWLLRWQVVLVYLGAAINKLLDPHWPSGEFLDHWARHLLHHATYISWSARLPGMLLAQLLSWLVIGLEFLLAVGFAIPRCHRVALALGIAFHGGMLVFSGGTLSVRFAWLMGAAYLVFLARDASRSPESAAGVPPRH